MKSFAVAAIVAIAAAPLAAAHGNMCDTIQIAQAFPEAQLTKCKTDSGFDLNSGTKPTATVLAKFCKSDTCLSLWKGAMALNIPECSINGVDLIEDILEPAEEAGCKTTASTPSTTTNTTIAPSAAASSNSTTTTKTPSTTSATPSSTTKAPSNSTSATPSTTTKTPSTTPSAAKTPSTTPSATTKAPTATSGASSLTVAVGTVMAAVGVALC